MSPIQSRTSSIIQRIQLTGVVYHQVYNVLKVFPPLSAADGEHSRLSLSPLSLASELTSAGLARKQEVLYVICDFLKGETTPVQENPLRKELSSATPSLALPQVICDVHFDDNFYTKCDTFTPDGFVIHNRQINLR